MYRLSIILLFFVASLVDCQEAYKWRDARGRMIYSSKPPKSNAKAESFKLRQLSTYSEDKVLKRLGKAPISKDHPPEFNISKKNSNLDQAKHTLKLDNPKRGDVLEVMLKSEVPVIDIDKDGLISSCKVEVINQTDRQAFEISVAFEFPDGTLVPASGPFELEANAKAEFVIPSELLPLDKRLGKNLGDSMESDKREDQALPKVIMHSLGSK